MKPLLKEGVRGIYADRYHAGTNLVLLEPDAAKAFPNEQAVKKALKLVIKLTKIQENACSTKIYYSPMQTIRPLIHCSFQFFLTSIRLGIK